MDKNFSISHSGRHDPPNRFWGPTGRSASILVLLLSVLSRMPAQQADDPEVLRQLSLEELTQIDITSVNKEPVTAFQTPAAINILTSDTIRRSGARTIPDLLRLIPGVNVGQIQSNQWAIGIRGFQGELTKSVLVMIDGRSVYTPLFAGVFWDMQDVMLEDIDRVEIIRGPAGTIWGSNAVNGVINIITKNARETRGTLVTAGAGNVEQGFLSWRYGDGTDQLSYRIYGKGFTRGPQYHPDGRNFDDWRRGQTGFRVDWQATGRDAVTVQGDAYGGEVGQQLNISTFAPQGRTIEDGYEAINGQNLMVAWRRLLRSGSDFQLRSYYDRTNRQELNFQEIRHTFDFDFLHHIPTERHDLTWGVGARISPSRFIQQVETVDFQPHEQIYNIFSGYVQDDIALVPRRLSLQVGSKFEYTSYSGFNYQPSARISWTPNAQQTIWAAVSRAVRTASRIEDGFAGAGYLGRSTYLRFVGDGQFTPEELIGYEFGYRTYVSAKGIVSLSLFHNRYDDLLSVELQPAETEQTPGPPRTVLPLLFRNGVVANSTGGELASLWDFYDWWRLRASYSLIEVDAKNKSTSIDLSTEGQLEGDSSQHKVILQSIFSLPADIELDMIYRYVSEVANQGVPAYSTGDVRLSRRLGDHFEVDVVGRNLLQPSHFEYGGAPSGLVGIRRSGYVALRWTP